MLAHDNLIFCVFKSVGHSRMSCHRVYVGLGVESFVFVVIFKKRCYFMHTFKFVGGLKTLKLDVEVLNIFLTSEGDLLPSLPGDGDLCQLCD